MALLDQKQDIVIFDGGEDGYGFAVARGKHSYNWTYNWDCRFPGRAVPAAAPVKIVATTPDSGPINAVFEWQEITGAGQVNNRPLMWAAGGNGTNGYLWRLRDGQWIPNILVTGFYVRNGLLYRYDQVGGNANTEMAFFCTGAAGGNIIALNQNGTLSTGTNTHKADSLWVIGADLWSVNGYQVQKLNANTDPGIDANYGALIPVGRPTYPVNKMLNLAGAPFVVKGDGVFRYSQPDFINLTDFVSPHPQNGQAAFIDGRGRLYYDTVDGDIIVLSVGFQTQQRPLRFTSIDRDTPWGRITAMNADAEFVYAVTEPGQIKTQQLGLTVMSNINLVWTNHTTAVTDGQFGTGADWTAAKQNDYFVIGADEPFAGFYAVMQAVRTSTLGSVFPDIQYSAGSGVWTTVAAAHDSTGVFLRDGLITPIDASGTDIFGNGSWKTDTVNGIANKYWLRILLSNASFTAGSFAGIKLAEAWIVPYRPPLSTNDLTNQPFPISGYAMAGALPNILVGQWRGEQIVWQHVWTLNAGRIDQLLIGRAFYPGSTGRRVLYAFNSEGVWAMPVGADSHPAHAPFPKLAAYSETPTSFSEHIIAFSAVDFGMPAKCNGGFEIDMPFVQTNDDVWVYWWWGEDAQTVYYDGPYNQSYIKTRAVEGRGRTLYAAIAFNQGQRRPVAPYLRHVKLPAGTWQYTEEDLLRADTASPQLR